MFSGVPVGVAVVVAYVSYTNSLKVITQEANYELSTVESTQYITF